MSETIRGTIDAAGRLVIPKPIREAAGLEPGRPLEIRLHDGKVEIQSAPIEIRIETQRGVAVALPSQPVPPVTSEEVEVIRRQIRAERDRRAR